ncbi:MAG: aminotransferase class I/II-fold pyridoxal phosphate-dependent enzyme [Thermoplasmata archaeon]|nr:aminotransferase class I/II-fold pyridoxal phosphate-dependent enzyme [Thermoplasmata archaeon]
MSDERPPGEVGAKRGRGRFDALPPWIGLGTRLIHAGRRPELNAGAVVPPIYQTSTYHYPPPFSEAAAGGDVHLYTRTDNPTHEVAEELIRQAEGGEAARVFASGMGAISATILSFVRTGDTVVALEDLYGGSLQLFSDLLPRLGVKVRWVTAAEAQVPASALHAPARVVYLETPSNPLGRVHDLTAWSEAADTAGALLVVDNTFATPVNQNPLEFGADLVVHSGTKYLGGHSDLLAGAVVGAADLMDRIDVTTSYLGAVLDPFAAFLLARGMRTLALRVARQNENGRRVAEALSRHPRVLRVDYPGRASPREEALAVRQMRGRGGVVALTLEGGEAAATRFLKKLRLVHVASSLGGVESLASAPTATSHVHLAPEERARRGIAPGTVRLALGVEEPDDLIRDLSEALD